MYSPRQLKEVLKTYWGYDQFRPLQEDIILSILKGKESIGLLPTGGGKSLCFQLPAMILPGYTLVVSPLIALINDQVGSLKSIGIGAAALHSGLTKTEMEEVLISCTKGRIKLLYISPERLNNQSFIHFLMDQKPSMLIVDEAHCISQWGHDFRPAYLSIHRIRKIYEDIHIHAFTATAGKKVLKDIKKYLAMDRPAIFRKSYRRENISFHIIYTEDKWRSLQHFIGQQEGSGIIYVRNRRKTKEISTFLLTKGIASEHYHAGLEVVKRDKAQEAWMLNKVKVMVCTNAFGMGVDKADVRFVIHLDLPADMESYYQEAGRAGRDGKPSWALLFYDHGDIRDLGKQFRDKWPSALTLYKFYKKLKQTKPFDEDKKWQVNIKERAAQHSISIYKFIHFLSLLKKLKLLTYEGDAKDALLSKISLNKTAHVKSLDASERKLLKEFDYSATNKGGKEISFDEKKLGLLLALNQEKINHLLDQMEAKRLIDYDRASGSIELTLNENLSMLKALKQHHLWRRHKERLLRIMQYFPLSAICRQSFILRYFNEDGDKNCKKCDICQKKKRSLFFQKGRIRSVEQIKAYWGGEKTEAEDLYIKWPFFERHAYTDFLNKLYYEEKLIVEGNILSINDGQAKKQKSIDHREQPGVS